MARSKTVKTKDPETGEEKEVYWTAPKVTQKDIYADAMARIEIAKARLEALDFSVRNIRDGSRWNYEGRSPLENAYALIRGEIYREVSEAYQHLFMWTTVFNKPALIKKAREIARKEFLSDKHNVMHLKGFWSTHNYSGYLVSEDEDFRELIEESINDAVEDEFGEEINDADMVKHAKAEDE